jgi:hypothetical protein
MTSYAAYLARKAAIDPATGIAEPGDMHPALFGYQADIVRWALRRGRAAIFAGTGLGKTLMELAWAHAVADFTGKPVLIFTPLAVAAQFIAEGNKFGLPCTRAASQSDIGSGVYVTNYDKRDRFDLTSFAGMVLDESSILKAHTGKTRDAIIEASQSIPFRLAATATPAPNDYMELGNHAQFLGVMTYAEMLAMFFVHDGGDTAKWRLKRHAESDFWQWMCSWSVMLTKPSDLGYDDAAHNLPPLLTHQHTVAVEYRASLDTGMLFPIEARTMQERLGARRDSIADRLDCVFGLIIGSFASKLATCHGSQNTQSADAQSINPKTQSRRSAEASQSAISTLTTAIQAAKSEGFFAALAIPDSDISKMTQNGLLKPWCIWCNLNSEQEQLAKAFGPFAFSVQGSMTDEQKEAAIEGWRAGLRPIMISKPSIMGFGMNFQHCADTAFVGLNDSFEQVFQAVRRFWRFGQTMPVNVHFIASEMEGAVVANLQRKEADANRMIAAMVNNMADLTSTSIKGVTRDKAGYAPKITRIPSFMEQAA